MPKILGYVPLMYGAEYLEASLTSMLPWVDKLIIVYVDRGSQGHHTNIPCPETKEQLQDIVRKIDSPKIEWHNCGTFQNENAHRNYILQFSEGYDLIFTLDADEVCEAQDMPAAIEHALNSTKRHISINGFINFWRSFDYVCLDGFRPFRFVNLRNPSGATDESDLCKLRIYHFSTCQSIDTIRFKWNVSGHANELRPGWIDSVYLGWQPSMVDEPRQNLHPVAHDIWNAVRFDKSTLPEVLKNHPNYNRHPGDLAWIDKVC